MIYAYLRAFLWDRAGLNLKKSKVVQEEICAPKKDGGLGLMRCKDWNKADNMKHIWNLLQSKYRSFWAKWIHSYRLRNKCFQEINPSSYSFWTWRKNLKLQKEVRERCKKTIGNREDTYLQLDNWHPNDLLLESMREE